MAVGPEPKEPAAPAAGAPAEEDKADAVACTICLGKVLPASGERSTAWLRCGHEFHLDCIGSAFNFKWGVMQCPNCRRIENGNWLFANGSRSAHDVSMDEWDWDDDFSVDEWGNDEDELSGDELEVRLLLGPRYY